MARGLPTTGGAVLWSAGGWSRSRHTTVFLSLAWLLFFARGAPRSAHTPRVHSQCRPAHTTRHSFPPTFQWQVVFSGRARPKSFEDRTGTAAQQPPASALRFRARGGYIQPRERGSHIDTTRTDCADARRRRRARLHRVRLAHAPPPTRRASGCAARPCPAPPPRSARRAAAAPMDGG